MQRPQFNRHQYYQQLYQRPDIKPLIDELGKVLQKEETEIRNVMSQPVTPDMLKELISRKMTTLLAKQKMVSMGLDQLERYYSIRDIVDSSNEQIQSLVKQSSNVQYVDLLGYTYRYKNMANGYPLGQFIVSTICGESSYNPPTKEIFETPEGMTSRVWGNPRLVFYLLKNCFTAAAIPFHELSYGKVYKYLNEKSDMTQEKSAKGSKGSKGSKKGKGKRFGGYRDRDRDQDRDQNDRRHDKRRNQNRDGSNHKDKDKKSKTTIKQYLERLHFVTPDKSSNRSNRSNQSNYFKHFNDLIEDVIKSPPKDNKVYITRTGKNVADFMTRPSSKSRRNNDDYKSSGQIKNKESLYEHVSYSGLITEQYVRDIRMRIFDVLYALYYFYITQFESIRSRYVGIFGQNQVTNVLVKMEKRNQNAEPALNLSQDIFGSDRSGTSNVLNANRMDQLAQLTNAVFEQNGEYLKYKTRLDNLMIQTNNPDDLKRIQRTVEKLDATYRRRIRDWVVSKPDIDKITVDDIIGARLLRGVSPPRE